MWTVHLVQVRGRQRAVMSHRPGEKFHLLQTDDFQHVLHLTLNVMRHALERAKTSKMLYGGTMHEKNLKINFDWCR